MGGGRRRRRCCTAWCGVAGRVGCGEIAGLLQTQPHPTPLLISRPTSAHASNRGRRASRARRAAAEGVGRETTTRKQGGGGSEALGADALAAAPAGVHDRVEHHADGALLLVRQPQLALFAQQLLDERLGLGGGSADLVRSRKAWCQAAVLNEATQAVQVDPVGAIQPRRPRQVARHAHPTRTNAAKAPVHGAARAAASAAAAAASPDATRVVRQNLCCQTQGVHTLARSELAAPRQSCSPHSPASRCAAPPAQLARAPRGSAES
eukprot:365214-Chlamydomonas_euryale.AAC.21